MKKEFYLVVFGVVLGLGLVGLSYPLLKDYASTRLLPEGAKFDSISDLRNALTSQSTKESKRVTLKDLIEPHSSDLIIYDLAANLDLRFQRASVKTNSYGMRDKEHSLEKPENVYRIAMLGDSFVFGWGVESHETFASVLERELNQKEAGNRQFEVLNFGVPGYSTLQEVESFLEKGLAFQPDAVIVFFVENDFSLPFYIRNLDTKEGLTQSGKFWHFGKKGNKEEVQKQRQELLDALKPRVALKKLAENCSERGIDTFLTVNPNKKSAGIFRQLRYVFKNNDIVALPIRKKFMKVFRALDLPDQALTLSFDPHPSPLKHKIIGEVLSDKLWAYITKPNGSQIS